MPTNKEIAGWLREAAQLQVRDEYFKKWLKRAALVESITCGSCRWFVRNQWHKDYGRKITMCENLDSPIICDQGPDFGCIHWEIKK